MSNLNDFLKTFQNEDDSDKNECNNDGNNVENQNIDLINENNLNGATEECKKPKNLKLKLKLKSNNNSSRQDKLKQEQEIERKRRANSKLQDCHNKEEIKDEKSEEIDRLNNAYIDKLFEISETPIHMKGQWIELYKKAIESNKQTMTNTKIKNGRFRLENDGKLIILSDMNTFGKSSKDLLNEQWS